jgi:predicted Zn-dependent protease
MRPSFQSKVSRWLALAAILIAAPSSAQSQIRPGFNLFTVQQDIQVGTQSASEIERRVPIVHSGYPVRYVERVGLRLAAQAPGADYPYRFRVANLSELVGAIPRSAPVGDLREVRTWLRRLPPAPTLAQVTAED